MGQAKARGTAEERQWKAINDKAAEIRKGVNLVHRTRVTSNIRASVAIGLLMLLAPEMEKRTNKGPWLSTKLAPYGIWIETMYNGKDSVDLCMMSLDDAGNQEWKNKHGDTILKPDLWRFLDD